jgi:hypothetical protein
MSNVFSFYFDSALVQAVSTRVSGGIVTVLDAHTFPHDELDSYLAGCREKSFIISYNPLLFHQDIVYLPPAAVRQYDKLVHSEVQRIHPELNSFTSFHTTVGTATIDTKLFNKIAAFSYVDDTLSSVLSVFTHRGKMVSRIYAAPYSIFKLIATTCQTDTTQSRIFIASLPGEKLFLVGENNELEFIRKMPSSDTALLPADIQNINMTLDYCFQTLRVRPAEAVVLEQSDLTDAETPRISVPLRMALPPALVEVPHHLLAEYLAPLAAVLHATTMPRSGDILPADYIAFARNRTVLSAGSALMVLCALLLAAYALTEWLVIADLKSAIATVRGQLRSSPAEMAAFRKLDEEVKSFNKPLEIIRKHSPTLHPAAALAALSLPGAPEYTIKGIAIQSGSEFLSVQIDGDISVSGFSNIQATFEWLIEQVGKIPGYAVATSTLDIKQKTFKLQARYTGTAQKGK